MESLDGLRSMIATAAAKDGEEAAIELFEHWLFQVEPPKKKPRGGIKKPVEPVDTQYAVAILSGALDALTTAVKRVATAVEYANHDKHAQVADQEHCPVCKSRRDDQAA